MKRKALTLCLGVLLTLSLSACQEGYHMGHHHDSGDDVTVETPPEGDEGGGDEGDGGEGTPEHTHSYTSVYTAPTCTEDGYTTYTCECGDSYVIKDEGTATGHSWLDWEYLDETYHSRTCSACNTTETEEHSYGDGVVIDPTHTEDGYTTYTCSVCEHSYTITDEGTATGHSWSDWADDENGSTHSRSCDSDEATETIEHNFDYDNGTTTSATCTEDEYVTYTCTDCGAEKVVTNEGTATGHSWSDWEYLDEKYHSRTCSACGETEQEEHTYGTGVVTDPTCNDSGYTTHTCEVCNGSYKDNETSATGHNLDTYHDPDTHITYTYCTECNEVFDEVEELYYSVTSYSVHTEECAYCDDYEETPEDHEDLDGDGNCDVCSCLNTLTYSTKNGNVTITGVGDYSGTEFVFPNEIDGNPVTTIDEISKGSNATIISIPASVTTLNSYAFNGCKKLTSLTFESGSQLATINSYAFQDCQLLTEITIPASVQTIGRNAFKDCYKLASLTFEEDEDSQLDIGEQAFYMPSVLKELFIPKSVTSIGQGAFNKCEDLQTLTFEEGIDMTMAKWAFADCYSLKSLEIPACLTSIETETFVNCKKLTSLIFEEGSQLTSIGTSAFEECNYLTELEIPASVETIGADAFYDCVSLTSLTFEEGSHLTSIGDEAFDYSALTYLSIPSSVVELGDWTFGDATQLKEFYVEGSEDGTSQLTTLGAVFASDGKSIGGIKTITLPGSIETITADSYGYYLFSNCSYISTINFWGTEEQWNSYTGVGTLPDGITINYLGN